MAVRSGAALQEGALMLQRSQHPAYPEWAQNKVSGLPYRWKKRLFNRWQKTRNDFDTATLGAEGDATRGAAFWLQDVLAGLRTVNIPLDASDSDICARADEMSKHCNSLAEVFHDRQSLRAAMERVLRANHIDPWQGKADKLQERGKPVPADVRDETDASAIARMIDGFWWRRQLRKLQAKAVEGAAINIGYVNKTRDLYVSNESGTRRIEQNKRNAAMLENTKARNEKGDEYTLAELAAKGVSNKAIKRGELMTRIAGFERIARDCNHVGLFFTPTCPSRMHKWKTVDGGRVVENAKYDGTLPDAAQSYLSKKFWAPLRTALHRRGVRWYGFRIAEPQHDGTPHWHVLVFFDAQWQGDPGRAALPRICALIRRYALKDSPDERGAKAHRCDFEPIDWEKGSAAGYIAKYVSKNIDGYRVDKDLYGNDAITTSVRVESWAATWRIRQFQQVGGAPVTVWREMRRVKSLPDGSPEHLVIAHRAVNKVAAIEGESASVAWDRYTIAQGGVFCGRDYRIKLAMEETQGTGRYGEPLGPRPVGVETVVLESYRDGIVTGTRSINWLARSVRYVWEIICRRSRESHAAIGRAWTRVNNCTRSNFDQLKKDLENVPVLFGPMPLLEKAEFFGPLNVPILEKSISADAVSVRDRWNLDRRYDDTGHLVST
jgi:hypothetical protein